MGTTSTGRAGHVRHATDRVDAGTATPLAATEPIPVAEPHAALLFDGRQRQLMAAG